MTARPSFKGRTAARHVADAGSNPAGRTTPPLTLTTDDRTVATTLGDLSRAERAEVPHILSFECDLCHGTGFVETVSDLVCTHCGCCQSLPPALDIKYQGCWDHATVPTDRLRVPLPLHPLGTTTMARPGSAWASRIRRGNQQQLRNQQARIRQCDTMQRVAQAIGMTGNLARASFTLARHMPLGKGVSSHIQGAWCLYATIRQHHLPIRLAALVQAYQDRQCGRVTRRAIFQFQVRHHLTLPRAGQPERLQDFLVVGLEAAVHALVDDDHDGHGTREAYWRPRLRDAMQDVIRRTPSGSNRNPAVRAAAITYAATLLAHCAVQKKTLALAFRITSTSLKTAWTEDIWPYLKEEHPA